MNINQGTSLLPQEESYVGQVTALWGDVLQGWVVNSAQPDRRVIIEILIDGVQFKTAHANQLNASATCGDHFHGFLVVLSGESLHHERKISVRVANTNFLLPSNIAPETWIPQVKNTDSVHIWYAGGLRVEGRLHRSSLDFSAVEFSLREGGKLIKKVTPVVTGRGFLDLPNSYQRFEIDLPWTLADGAVHKVEILDEQGRTVAGSPIKVICWPQGLENLLHTDLSAGPDRLIKTVAELARLPLSFNGCSVSFRHYDSWFRLFQSPELEIIDHPLIRIGFLIIRDHANQCLSNTFVEDTGGHADTVKEQGWECDIIPAVTRLIASKCQVVIPVRLGDRLAHNAIPSLCHALKDGAAWAYGDCDQDGPEGERCSPWFKPQWDINLFFGNDLFSEGAIFTNAIIKRALSICRGLDVDKISWNQLLAGIVLATEKERKTVGRVSKVVYHKRFNISAEVENEHFKPTRQSVIAWLCNNIAPGTTVAEIEGHSSLLRVIWPLNESLPRVSIIVPTRDRVDLLRQCIDGLINRTDYPNVEIIIVDNQSTSTAALDYMASLKASNIIVLKYDREFNYAAINNRAAEVATGEFLLFLNNDITITNDTWLKNMIREFRPDTGVVGAKLLWHNGMVQHAGVAVGIDGLVAHIGNKWSEHDAGYLGCNQVARKLSAVTGACMMTRKSIYNRLGGMDHEAFPISLNDVDYCLRVQDLGFHVVWTPFAKMLHAESASRGKDDTAEKRSRAIREQTIFMERWTIGGWTDSHYHPLLSHDYSTGPYGGLVIPRRY